MEIKATQAAQAAQPAQPAQASQKKQQELVPGMTYQAKAIFVSDSGVNLKFPGGEIIYARLENGMLLTEGETVMLEVVSSDPTQIVLNLADLAPQNPLAQAADPAAVLKSLGLAESALNLNIAEALINMKIAPQAEVFTQTAQILEDFPQLTDRGALFAVLNGIKPDEKTARLLAEIYDGKADAGRQIHNIIKLFEETGNLQAGGQAARRDASRVPTGETSAQQSQQPVTPEQAARLIIHNSVGIKPQVDAQELVRGLSELIADLTQPATEDTPPPAARDIREAVVNYIARNAPSLTPAKAEQIADALFLPHSAGEIPETDEKSLPEKLFTLIEKDTPQKGAALLESADGLQNKARLVRLIAETATGTQSAQSGAAQKLADSTKLYNDINQFVYTQIPFRSNGREQTAELYIFKNNRKGTKIDPENADILIALDTENLRRVEMLVSVREKTLTLRFAVESEKAADFMRENITEVYKLMRGSGYKIADTQFDVLKQPVRPQNALEYFYADLDLKRRGFVSEI